MHDWVLRCTPPVLRGYLRLVGATTRYRLVGEDWHRQRRQQGEPCLGVIWHNRLLGPVQPYSAQRAGVAISLSKDGELISRVVEPLGLVPLRGSSSRGGARVLRGMLAHLKLGRDVVFTPDGPRGPRYTVQPGVALLARRTGLPVLPVGVSMSRKKVFSSWDRFQLPLPFGTILLRFGEPLWFTPEDSLDAVRETIRAALMEATEQADQLLGVRSP